MVPAVSKNDRVEPSDPGKVAGCRVLMTSLGLEFGVFPEDTEPWGGGRGVTFSKPPAK